MQNFKDIWGYFNMTFMINQVYPFIAKNTLNGQTKQVNAKSQRPLKLFKPNSAVNWNVTGWQNRGIFNIEIFLDFLLNFLTIHTHSAKKGLISLKISLIKAFLEEI